MGRFSRDTYRLLKQPDASGFVRDYRNVRLQMGVPLVDADWNELEDIRKHEFRSMMAGVVGNGRPAGSNGFEIFGVTNVGMNLRPAFTIRAGSIVVDGMMVTNPADVAFDAQEYYGEGAGLVRATQRGVTPVTPLAPVTAFRFDHIYLEVWEREVTAAEDPRLMDNVLLEETSTRVRLEWAVRVTNGTVPASTETHRRLTLARLAYYQSGTTFRAELIDVRNLVAGKDHHRIVSIAPVGQRYTDLAEFRNSLNVSRTSTTAQNSGMMINVTLPHGARVLSLRTVSTVKEGALEVTFYRVRYGGAYGYQDDLAFSPLWEANEAALDVTTETDLDVSVVDNNQFYYRILAIFFPNTATSSCQLAGFQIQLQL
ncbi:MAG: hypothetical protein K0R39_2536 [Symbiobacteriaceae bacterium]|jgi:hypothetical protein|nr:hypothetical protein [Symbiobacteriaceae bacterium]